MSKLEEIRKLLAEQEAAKNNRGGNQGPSAIYPFWNLDAGGKSILRFLPDGNAENPFPYVENAMIRLLFPGIKGQTPKQFEFKVPCVEMWGLSCPILGHIRKEKWFDDSDTETLGRQYWKKRSWLLHGFVTEDGTKEEDSPENLIRRFIFGKQLLDQVKAGLIDPDLEEAPYDIERGTDFVVSKTDGGQFANYSTSKFRNRERPLSEAEKAAIEKYGIPDLTEYRAKKPTDEELNQIFEMFLASVNGDFYDAEKYGNLPWRPSQLRAQENKEDKKETESTTETVSETASTAVTEDKADKVSAEDILARLRKERQSA